MKTDKYGLPIIDKWRKMPPCKPAKQETTNLENKMKLKKVTKLFESLDRDFPDAEISDEMIQPVVLLVSALRIMFELEKNDDD